MRYVEHEIIDCTTSNIPLWALLELLVVQQIRPAIAYRTCLPSARKRHGKLEDCFK